jgi:hypothetical protein
MTSIERKRKDVQRAFEALSTCADTAEKQPFFVYEAQTWTLLLALGRALTVLFLARQVARPRSADYEFGGRRFVLEDEPRTSELGTRCGKVDFTRPVGRPTGARRKEKSDKVDLPVDRELGLCGGFSLSTVVGVVRLCAMMAFGQARQTFETFHEWTPSSRATLRMVDAVGAEAQAFIDQAPAPADDGEILVIQVDGRGAPMITTTERERRARPHQKRTGTKRAQRRARRKENPRPRRRKGDKSKNAKVAVLGVIYTLRKTDDGYEGPINKQIIGTFHSHRALMRWLRRQADKRGYGRKKTLFLADGSEHIWREKAEFFPKAEGCLDWFHVVEKLWEAGRFFYAEGSKELTKWVNAQKKLLRDGKVWEVIDALASLRRRVANTGPGTKKKRTRLDDIIIHFGDHAEHMRYDSFRRRGLDIGTGAVEGAVRNVVAVRLDGPGMRWGRQRSELILHLRCILVSGQWDAFVRYLAGRNGVTLKAQPIEASPHAAAA